MLSLYALFTLLLLSLLLVVFVLLVIPLDLALALQLDEKDFRGRATLKWLFFSYTFSEGEEKDSGKGKFRKKKKKEGRGKKDLEKPQKEGREFSFYLKVFRALYRPLFRLCADFLSALKFREFDCFLAFGFENPADTGMSCGFLYGMKGVLEARCARCRLDFTPNFLEQELKVRGNAKIRIRPYLFGFAFLKFLFDRRTLGLASSIFLEEIRKLWPKV